MTEKHIKLSPDTVVTFEKNHIAVIFLQMLPPYPVKV